MTHVLPCSIYGTSVNHMDCADTVAILISIVSKSYYGMLRGANTILICPPEHPIMSFEKTEIKMATVSVKRSISCIKCVNKKKKKLL